MTALTVYIDEGGDSGIRDGLHYSSTRYEWFTIAAYVLRTDNTADAQAVRDQILHECRCRQMTDLHYHKLKEDRRSQACRILSGHSARAFVLASHKSNLREHVNPKLGSMSPGEFYNWCSRLLLERVMDFAALDQAAARQRDPQLADRPAPPLELVFSENKGHDYEAMFAYFETCNLQAAGRSFKLKPKAWLPSLMDRSHWSVVPHSDLAGLQLADVVASAFLQGANSNSSNHDASKAMSLSRIMAKDRHGAFANAGVTLWPLSKHGPIPPAARPLFKFYGYTF